MQGFSRKYYNFAISNGAKVSPEIITKVLTLKIKIMAICKCPAAAALPNIPNFTCAESFGQIQKVAFQRLYKSTGEKIHLPRRRVLGKSVMDAVVIGRGRHESCCLPVYPSTDSRSRRTPYVRRRKRNVGRY